MNPLAALFPATCLLCRALARRDIDLCLACEQAFAPLGEACPVCAEPAAGIPPPGHLPGERATVCGSCLAAPPPWTRTVAAFAYSPPLSAVVEGLKSGNGLLQARILGRLLAAAVARRYTAEPLPEAVVPMPLTGRRLRRRGFNQAALLAAELARPLGLRPLRRCLARVRDAPPQRALARAARQRNVRGAFAARRPLPAQRVALVDDVATTGATARAAAMALRRAGAEEVHVWVVAKTPADRIR